MAEKQIINDFTAGNIPKKLIYFALPFMASNAMQVLYSLVDMIVVGKFVGSYGLSAVSVASQVFTFVTMICLGFCTGGQVYISQLIGAKMYHRINKTIGTLFSLIAILGVLMTIVCLTFRDPVLSLINTPLEAYDMALDYLVVCGIGLIFTYGYNLVSAILRGMGDSKHPFYFIMIASIINVVLDLLFVAVFHWSVAGAALATILGQAFSFMSAIFYLYHHKDLFYFDFKLTSFTMDQDILKKMAKLGIPFALQSGAINISMLFVNSLVNSVGVYASATYGVGMKLDDIINKVTQGMTFAVSAMAGQNIAAKKYDRAKEIVYTSWKLSTIFYILFTIAFIILKEEMFGFFTSDPEVIALAGVFVYGIVWSYPAMVIMRGTNGFIQAVGNAKLSLVFALLDGFVFRITLSYLFGIIFDLGLFGFILGFALAPYGTAIPSALYFFSQKWKKIRLVD